MLETELGVFPGTEQTLMPPGAVREAKSRRRSAAKPSILVVDDQQIIADSLADILNGSGFCARAAYGGQEALQLADAMRPDYLLTDVVMPAMNGVQLAIAITQKMPATRIVLLSGQAGISDILQDGRRQGYDFELVAKPIHPDQLIEHLRELGKK